MRTGEREREKKLDLNVTSTETSTVELLAVGEASKAIVWLAQDINEGTLDSSTFSAEDLNFCVRGTPAATTIRRTSRRANTGRSQHIRVELEPHFLTSLHCVPSRQDTGVIFEIAPGLEAASIPRYEQEER